MTLHELDSFTDMMAEQKLKVTGVRMPKEEMDEFVESCRKAASVPDNLFWFLLYTLLAYARLRMEISCVNRKSKSHFNFKNHKII